MILSRIQILGFILLVALSCKKKDNEPLFDSMGLSAAIGSAEIFPIPQASSFQFSDTIIVNEIRNGVEEACTTFSVKAKSRFEELSVFYATNYSEIWPGNIVQGKYVQESGRLVSFAGSGIIRKPIEVGISGSMRSTPALVIQNPSEASVSKKITDNHYFFWFDSPLFTFLEGKRNYSKNQVSSELGFNAGWLTGNVSVLLSNVSTTTSESIVLSLKQVYYTASCNRPLSPSDFFAPGTDVGSVKSLVVAGNPPLYIQSVQYGRVALINIKTASKSDQVIRAFKIKLGIISGNLTFEDEQLLESSEYSVFVAGGPAIDAWRIENIKNYFDSGNVFNPRTGVVPVSFTLNHLKDNSPYMFGTQFDYRLNTCN